MKVANTIEVIVMVGQYHILTLERVYAVAGVLSPYRQQKQEQVPLVIAVGQQINYTTALVVVINVIQKTSAAIFPDVRYTP